MKFATFNTDSSGGFSEFEVKDHDETEAVTYIKDVVGGFLESVTLYKLGVTMWINEEGKLLGLPVNPIGTMFWTAEYGSTDTIVGNIVLTGIPDNEGWLTGLDEDFATMLASCLHGPEDCPKNQEQSGELQ